MAGDFEPNLNLNLTHAFEAADECMFQRHPPPVSMFCIYGLAVPTLAAFGLCTNFINAVVFMRPKMTPSAFTYLAALSWLDCVSCLLITLTSLSRSYLYQSTIWITYDYQWQSPLFGISTGAGNLILACVSCDRFVYLTRFRVANGAPRFCRRKVARCMIFVAIAVSVVVNLPYFFIFVVDEQSGRCHVTNLYNSKFYVLHNWFTFTLLALLPAIFLLLGNAAIIVAFRRWTKQSRLCQQSCSGGQSRTTQKRYHHQMKLTISIVIVITLYMIGELPAHMTSRKSALNLLFGGNKDKVNVAVMERLEVICISLNALQLSMNIVVYAVINPSFMPEFFVCLRGASDVCFNLCCLPALARAWRRCWACCSPFKSSETAVVSSVTPPGLPADEQLNCGCESWSTDSGCGDVMHDKATAGTFTFNEDQQSQLQLSSPVFTTKSSACMQLRESMPEENSLFNSSFMIIT